MEILLTQVKKAKTERKSKIVDDSFKKSAIYKEKQIRIEQLEELIAPNGDGKIAKDLGHNRWRYQGKRYKEVSIDDM